MKYVCFYYRTRLHLYTKKQIYNEVAKAVFSVPEVKLVNLTGEDINNYKT